MSTYKNKDTTIKIGDKSHKVVVSAFPARAGLKLQIRIARLIAPIIGNSMGSDPKASKVNINGNEIVSALTNALDEDSVELLILKLLEQTAVNDQLIGFGNESQFDMLFNANYGFLMDVIKFVLEVNFGSFLEKMGISFKESPQS